MKAEKKEPIAAVVGSLCEPLLARHSLSLWDVQFQKEAGYWYLRVLVDKDGGLDMNSCEAFSRELSNLLDEKDPIEHGYYLEVGTPGLERKLTKPHHFQESIGRTVHLHLIREQDGVRDVTGTLLSCEDAEIAIQTGEAEFRAPKANVSYVKLYFDYELEQES